MGSFYDTSVTPASNTTVGGIAATGGTTLNFFDDVVRELASHGPKFIRDFFGAATVGGTANAITITLQSGSLAAEFAGMGGGFIATADNTGTVELNVGSAGAEPLKKAVNGVETALVAGDIKSGEFYIYIWRSTWDSGNGAWQLLRFNEFNTQGIAKAWAHLNGTGTIALYDSYNVSSINDNGSGSYTLTMTNAMNNANFATSHGVKNQIGSYDRITNGLDLTTTTFHLQAMSGANTPTDMDQLRAVVFGDLA